MTQKAAVAALTECDGSVSSMREEFEKRRNFLVERVQQIPNVRCVKPKGAFYVMPNISHYLQKNKFGIKTSVDLCTYLLREYHIAIVPGSAFGAENFVRFSYANSMENIRSGLDRFEQGLLSLLK
jgi:aspartate aminotransferase